MKKMMIVLVIMFVCLSNSFAAWSQWGTIEKLYIFEGMIHIHHSGSTQRIVLEEGVANVNGSAHFDPLFTAILTANTTKAEVRFYTETQTGGQNGSDPAIWSMEVR